MIGTFERMRKKRIQEAKQQQQDKMKQYEPI